VIGARNPPAGDPRSVALPNENTDACPSRHGAVCSAVWFAVAGVVVHDGSNTHGGTHDAVRHTTGPTHGTSWWHWPYRNWLQHTWRWSQEPVPQWHWQEMQLGAQMPLAPQPHPPHVALQSTM
jgi:hypothetical protein